MITVGKMTPVPIITVSNRLLEGKIALIIGGSGGIGFGIARRFIESGARVILSGTNENKLKDACSRLGEDAARYIILDLLKISDIKKKINDALDLFEDGQIDILVNSAGVHGEERFGEVTERTYDVIFDVNLKGMFFVCQEVADYMKKSNIKGRILNVSSASSIKPAWTPYEISKWGVRGFTLGLASELIKYGIIVNSIAPGPVATSMLNKQDSDDLSWPFNPSGRMATPEEIGNLAVFMVSDLGSLIVGDTYFISGGSGTICIDK